MSWLLVASGSALGALARYLVVQLVPWNGVQWPLGTLIVNTLGSFTAGALYVVIAGSDSSGQLKLFWLTGVLGGFTTYSAFALETVILQVSGQYLRGTLYVVATVCCCMLAARFGYLLAQER